MIDTHCHLDCVEFDADRAAVLERSRRAGVTCWVVPGVRVEDGPRLLALREEPGIVLAPGLHPLYQAEHPADAVMRLESSLDAMRPVALGEIGLDHLADPATHAAQLQMFADQLDLAMARKLPVLLHVRKAHDRVLALLRQRRLPRGGIVHAFGGSPELARNYLDLGFALGFGGVVTWERARRYHQLARVVPDGAIVLETDAPDLPPAGWEGRRNEPALLPRVAVALALLRGVTPEALATLADANARRLLHLP
ncbi:MAG: TatD family hydrolase [Magnetococcus sp. WYHC-3]